VKDSSELGGFSVAADKLILLSPQVRKDFQGFAEVKGQRRSGYSHVVDLQSSEFRLPVRLYCGGVWNGINKIEFIEVAKLGLGRVQEIARLICADSRFVKIARIDWAVDILGLSAWDLAACCRVNGVMSSAFYRSRGGVSFYPHRSKARSVVIYERGKWLKANHCPPTTVFTNEVLTRLEVQFRGKGVPIREFLRIGEYRHVDVLRGVSFERILPTPKAQKPLQVLAAEGLRSLTQKFGLQNASKRFSASEWAHLEKTFFAPMPADFPNLHSLMKKSVLDSIENRLRFPRF
jgi:hypothetical protein